MMKSALRLRDTLSRKEKPLSAGAGSEAASSTGASSILRIVTSVELSGTSTGTSSSIWRNCADASGAGAV